jgi:hypothetical protein
VGDRDRSPALQKRLDRLLDGRFGFGVDGGSGLIEDEDRGVPDDGAGEGNQLFLALGERAAAIFEDGVVAFWLAMMNSSMPTSLAAATISSSVAFNLP